MRNRRQFVLVCCVQKNVNLIMSGFGQTLGTNLKLKSASCLGPKDLKFSTVVVHNI